MNADGFVTNGWATCCAIEWIDLWAVYHRSETICIMDNRANSLDNDPSRPKELQN